MLRARPRHWLSLLATCAAVGAMAPTAAALPGDPPFAPLAPADGASVAAGPAVVTVSFQCPPYRAAVYDGGDGNLVTDYRDASDYRVHFSTSRTVDANGALAADDLGGVRSAALTADGTTCTAALDSFEGGTYRAAVGRRVFWQVYRYYNGCTPQDEKAPVRSFVVRPTRIVAQLKAPRHVYSGYAALFALKSKADPGSANVSLQYRRGKTWRTFAHHGLVTDRTELIGRLPAGRQAIRAVIATSSFRQTVATRTVAVLRPAHRRATSARDDGSYVARDRRERATARLSFTIADGGRTLRDFKASVSTFCIGPTLEDNHIYVASAVLRKVKVAPDGSVTGYLATRGQGAELKLTGRLRNRRFQGKIDARYSTCSGVRKLDTIRH